MLMLPILVVVRANTKYSSAAKEKACPQCGKRYARDSMTKIAARLYPGVGYRQVVLTLPGCGLMGRTENYSYGGTNNG